jgi:hypothetical protein
MLLQLTEARSFNQFFSICRSVISHGAHPLCVLSVFYTQMAATKTLKMKHWRTEMSANDANLTT